MMDFIRGLAPRRDGHGPAAIPVLPSRFAAVAFSESHERITAAPTAPAASSDHVSARGVTGPARADDNGSKRRADSRVEATGRVIGRTPDTPASPVPEVPAQPVQGRQRTPEIETGELGRAAGVTEPRGQVAAAAADGHVNSSRPVTSHPTSASASNRAPLETAPRVPPPRAVPVSPLSREALATRSPQAGERPVIEVTIERIDVRAPASSARPPRPARPRTMPSVSLGDYLRAPERTGGSR
jgi:hypothetical protein